MIKKIGREIDAKQPKTHIRAHLHWWLSHILKITNSKIELQNLIVVFLLFKKSMFSVVSLYAF